MAATPRSCKASMRSRQDSTSDCPWERAGRDPARGGRRPSMVGYATVTGEKESDRRRMSFMFCRSIRAGWYLRNAVLQAQRDLAAMMTELDW